MATNFPTSIDSLTNPEAGNALNSPSHSEQHANSNDAIEALQAKVGVDSSTVATSHDYKIAQLESGKEDIANKENTTLDTSSTKYPTNNLVKTYVDNKNYTASDITDFDTEVSNNTDVSANTSARHSAVTVTDSSEIDFTLTGQDITASLKSGSIDESKLNTSVNASLDLADSALQETDKATGAEIDTGTDDAKYATPKAIADSDYIKVSDILNSQSTASASSITPTGNYKENEYYVTALTASLTINAPSGTATNGNTLMIRIKDNGTSRTLTFNSIYSAVGITLPTATTISKVLYIGAIYNSTSSKWEVVSINEEE